jgi:hypothetical protein
MKNNITKYDKTEIYENEGIVDLMVKLKQKCGKFDIPMIVTFALKNDENGTEYKTEMISAVSSGINLKEDRFVKFVNVMNGFDTIPHKEEMNFNVEDLL